MEFPLKMEESLVILTVFSDEICHGRIFQRLGIHEIPHIALFGRHAAHILKEIGHILIKPVFIIHLYRKRSHIRIGCRIERIQNAQPHFRNHIGILARYVRGDERNPVPGGELQYRLIIRIEIRPQSRVSHIGIHIHQGIEHEFVQRQLIVALPHLGADYEPVAFQIIKILRDIEFHPVRNRIIVHFSEKDDIRS